MFIECSVLCLSLLSLLTILVQMHNKNQRKNKLMNNDIANIWAFVLSVDNNYRASLLITIKVIQR